MILNPLFGKIIPIIAIFAVGYVLKRLGIFKKEDGETFLKAAFYVTLPALVVNAVRTIPLTKELAYLPLLAVLIILVTFVVSYFAGKALHLEPKTLGVFLVGTMIMNLSFALPFIIAGYGTDGVARLLLFDLGNTAMVFTFIYYIACRHGEARKSPRMMLKKCLSVPVLWALALGIALNLFAVHVPTVITNLLDTLGAATAPLIMLAVGIYFNFKIVKPVPLAAAFLLRTIGGLALGWGVVTLAGLSGMERVIVLLSSAMPIGYNTLTFAVLENLDVEFAASLLSLSILAGLIYVPMLMLALG